MTKNPRESAYRRDINSTDYIHPNEENLFNLHKAMEYDLAGKPQIRVAAKLSGPTIAGQVSAFGEPLAISPTAVIQLDGIYGATSEGLQTYASGTGSIAGSVNGMFQVSTGTTQGGYGVLRSKRFLRYRPGQGIVTRFTAAFTQGVAGGVQYAGLANQENRLVFGYDGAKFGICRSTGGKAHITLMTMTAAPNATQTATITLNGVAYTVTLNASASDVAIATITNRVGGYGGWLFQQTDGAMQWLAPSLGPMNGTFSFTSTGNATATFVTKQVGVAQTDYWTYQEDWNVDKMDGSNTIDTNPSGMTIDPTKLNVYQISLRWLGAGAISYAMEDQASGALVYVHREHYTNQHTVPHIANPSFKISYAAYNTTNATNLTVKGASIYGAVEGTIWQNELNRSYITSKTSLAKDTVHHMMTVKNSVVTNGLAGANSGNYIINAKEAIIKSLNVSVQSTDPTVVYLFFEPKSFSGTHIYNNIPVSNEVSSIITGTLDPTLDNPCYAAVLQINGAINIDLSQYRITVPPDSYITIALTSTNAISRATAGLVWSED